MKSKRTLALEWWHKMTISQKMEAVENWKKTTDDKKKEWDFVIISMSSITIQQIWEERPVTEINK